MNTFVNHANKPLKQFAPSARLINRLPAQAAEKQTPDGNYRW